MEVAISAAKPRLSALVAAVRRGERVVITHRGDPAVELVACPKRKRRGGIDFKKLEAACKRHGIQQIPPEEARELFAEFDDPAFSREVLGLSDDYEPLTAPPASDSRCGRKT